MDYLLNIMFIYDKFHHSWTTTKPVNTVMVRVRLCPSFQHLTMAKGFVHLYIYIYTYICLNVQILVSYAWKARFGIIFADIATPMK